MGLFHGIDFLAHKLHLIDLCLNCIAVRMKSWSEERRQPPQGRWTELTLMFVVFRLSELALEFGANLIQQLVEARRSVARRHAPHTAVRIHGHFCDAQKTKY